MSTRGVWQGRERRGGFPLRAALWAGMLVVGGLGGRWLLLGLGHLTLPVALAQRMPDAGPAGAPMAPRPLPAKVKITFLTVPVLKNVKVEVRWGKKRLGFIEWRKPFVLERIRDSGPIDVTLKAEGYLTVNTRAYTFEDNKIFVKMTPVTEKHTLLGYRLQLPDAGPDGGAPAGDAGLPPAPFEQRPPPLPAPGQPLPAPTAPVPPPTLGPAPPPPAP